jgi:hypothetical protein
VTRFPFAPLAALMALSEHLACQQLRVSGRTAQEYRRDGVSALVADRLAVRAGFHPAEVWPSWWDDTGYKNTPDRRRATYRADAVAAEARRQSARNYYAENGAYVRARERRRYRENREAILARRRERYQEKRQYPGIVVTLDAQDDGMERSA